MQIDVAPEVDPDSETGLFGARCQCGDLSFPAAKVCSRCLSTRLEPFELGNTGRLYSYTVLHTRPEGPVALGYCDLPNGLRVFGELTAIEALSVNMEVQVSRNPGGRPLCLFTPVSA